MQSALRVPPAMPAVPAAPGFGDPVPSRTGAASASAPSLPMLVSRVYAALPLRDRARLLEPLIRPMGVLALMVVAGGVFARLRLQSGWPDLNLPLAEVARVGADEVAALADHVQQMGRAVLDPLLAVLADLMPAAPSSAEVGAMGEALARWSSDRGAADATLAVLAAAAGPSVLRPGVPGESSGDAVPPSPAARAPEDGDPWPPLAVAPCVQPAPLNA